MEHELDNNNDKELTQTEPVAQKYKRKSSRKSSLDFRKYTKQIWLAGLGAFSRAEEEGNKMFDSLVKVGEELESKTIELTDQTVNRVAEKTKESVTDTRDRVEKLLDQGVSSSLNKIGLVSTRDIQQLENQISELNHKMDQLLEENRHLQELILKKLGN